jgi:hypothetical protein
MVWNTGQLLAENEATVLNWFGPGIVISTNLVVNGAITTPAYITSASSVTASAFYGNGAGLTSITRTSATVIPNTDLSNTAFGVAIATVTLTTRGYPVVLRFSATGNSTNQTTVKAGILVDGAYTVQIGTRAFSSARAPQASADFGIGDSVILEGLSAATHTFGLMFKTGAGTVSILNDSGHYPQLSVREAP